MTTTHYRTCNICEAMCGVAITVQSDRSLRIVGDKDDPFSRGHICPKAVALQDVYHDKDRLKHPMRRTDTGWQRIGWDEAFDEVAANLKRIQARYGSSSVGVYIGNPTTHNYGSLLFGPNFIRSLHTRNRFAATSVDQLAHHVAGYLMFGHQLLLPVPDLDRTDYLLIIGANPAVSNGSLMTAGDAMGRIQAIRKRGGKVVLIDPRFTETARQVDRHLFIRPGTDVLLLLAILQVLFAEQRVKLGRLAAFTDGLDEVARFVADFTPERVASVTGIDAEQVRVLAREFAAARTAACYGRMGVSTKEFGAACQWLINVINAVTGNLDEPGGAMFTLPAFDAVTAPEALAPRGSLGRWHSRVRKLPEFAGELPAAVLAEEMLTPGAGQIKAMVTLAGNPVLSTPNGRQLDRAFAGLEFMVSIDIYLNETTRHANIILPPTHALEHENYDLAFNLLAVRNTTKYSPALFAPAADTRHDWQILLELETRINAKGGLSTLMAKGKRALINSLLGPERMLDLGLRFGPHGAGLNPFSRGLTLARLKEAEHGIDLGALTSGFPQRLCTADKRIKLAPAPLVKDIERVEERLLASAPVSSAHDLQLIGRRHLRSNNSWLHNSERMVKGKDRCTLLMHPQDATRRHITDGQTVSVSSRVGSVELAVEVTEEIMPGVVSIPHGWGHDRPGVQLGVARQHAGVSVNDLTDEMSVDALSGAASFTTWVAVAPVKTEMAVEQASLQTV